MCGICGFIAKQEHLPEPGAALHRLNRALLHRGPDDSGEWTSKGVALAARRLSIIDLTGGHQPMQTEDGQLTLVFNGEIYNLPDLRAALEAHGHRFRTRSDTECLLHLYRQHGEEMLSHLRGMFAFALWDAPRRRLMVARDRLGKKPLYYFNQGTTFAFASEIKSLLEFPLVSRRLDWEAVDGFLQNRWISSPRSAFRRIRKLLPGHYLLVEHDKPLVDHCYWTPPRPSQRPNPLTSDELDELLHESVRLRLLSDVPVGAFLSGGVDSSLVVALMTRLYGQPIKTFSIGFDTPGGFNEAPSARFVSEQLGTQHYAHVFTAQDLVQEIRTAVYHLDEPLADAACVPVLLMSRAAAREVKVVLSGEGADELFAGYTRHKRERFFARAQRSSLYPLARRLAELSTRLPLSRRSLKALDLFLQEPASRIGAYHRVFSEAERAELFEPLAVLHRTPPEPINCSEFPSTLDWLLWEDMRVWLPDDLLMKVDKMSMAVSLEARTPYLDHILVERVMTIPARDKIISGHDKMPLRRVAQRYLPASIAARPKHGFDIPLDSWLRTELKAFAKEALFEESGGPLSPNQRAVSRYWDEHQQGRDNHGLKLWALVCWNLWRAAYRPSE